MFDEHIRFKYTWRDYQARVLNKAQEFVDDGHIHVVAAPGSGKTVLGLELMRRINLPTIILAPTIAIRNQWAERFTELFMENPSGETLPEWLSLDAHKPAKLTIITYQGLYSALAGQAYKQEAEAAAEQAEADSEDETFIDAPEEPEPVVSETITVPSIDFTSDSPATTQPATPPEPAQKTHPKAAAFLAKLNELGIRTIIVDEAHHLRNEWWRSLNDLKLGLKQPVVIALTATPPYDVEPAEWRRYQSFCGPIDIEVPVPELVGKKDLCPHQDYVYLSLPSDAEDHSIREVKSRLKTYLENLKSDQEFISALLAHPALTDDAASASFVLDNPEYFTALGLFLRTAGHDAPGKKLLKLISGRYYRRLPRFNEAYAEILLNNALYRDPYFASEANEALVKRLRATSSRAGALEARQVCLTNNKLISNILRQSVSKLEAVQRIVTFEQATFGSGLRCVILTDFIRREYLPPHDEPPGKLGVVPIFETLRLSIAQTSTQKIAVLSGVLVVLPSAATKGLEERLKAVAQELGQKSPNVSFKPYPTDDRFATCSVSDQTRQFMVRAVTQLFEAGEVEIIVGTKSLLGEGWDAPAINSLVLASFVGSFMLSNQMRGRAIRIDKRNPDKVANIWHIATVLPAASNILGNLLPVTKDLGPEYNLLSRRFESFVGIDTTTDSIESGLRRALYLPAGPYAQHSLPEALERANHQSFEAARGKAAVRERWHRTLASGAVGQLVHATLVEKPKLPRGFVYTRTLQAALLALFLNWLTYIQMLPEYLTRNSYQSGKEFLGYVLFVFGILSLVTFIRFVRYIIVALKHFSPERSMQQVGEALLHALASSGDIKTPPAQLRVTHEKTADGTISCGLKGGSTYENDVFLDCLEELLSPIANPRYLIKSGGKYWSITAGANYFSVPTPLARHKKTVRILLREWKKRVGPCQAIYTRSPEGRNILLKARRDSISGRLGPRSTRHTVWQ